MDWLEIAIKVGPLLATVIIIPIARSVIKAGLVTKEDFNLYREAHDATHAAVDHRLNAGEVRFVRMETILEHMPTQDDVRTLVTELNRSSREIEILRGDLKALSAAVKAVQHDAEILIDQHLEAAR